MCPASTLHTHAIEIIYVAMTESDSTELGRGGRLAGIRYEESKYSYMKGVIVEDAVLQ